MIKSRPSDESPQLSSHSVPAGVIPMSCRLAGNAPSPRVGRPRLEAVGDTLEARAPWKAAKMSRATWYRREREKREVAK